jgi:hypothetical protein
LNFKIVHCARSLLKNKELATDGEQGKKSPSSYNTSESIVNATDISFEDTIPKNALHRHLEVRANSKKCKKIWSYSYILWENRIVP